MRKHIVASISAACLLASVMSSSAAVTPQGWWHYGEISDLYGDSSGNSRRFGSAFSRVGSGNAGVGIEPFGCGGPLGDTGWTSTSCLFWTPTHADAAGMWQPGNATDPGNSYNPPATNYVIELWCLPQYPGTLAGNNAWLFCSGEGGGVRFALSNWNDGLGTMDIKAIICGNNIEIGNPWVVDTNHWTHLAVVNDNGVQTFYVNGVPNGAPDTANATIPAGVIYGGSAPGTQPTYDGYLDELRISTFAPGQFSLTNLLTRSMAPNIQVDAHSAAVWSGGAAPFTVSVALDTSTTYAWQRGGVPIGNATESEYYLNVAGPGDNAAQFECVLNNYTGISKTSSVATLTVVTPNPSDIAAYESTVTAEPSLLAYYPVDANTGATLTDIKGGHNGTLEGTAEYDGRTNRAFGVRALRFRSTADGDVTIPNVPAFEFGTGNGTIEAIVYLDNALSTATENIFAEANDGGADRYYALQVSPDGTSLIYTNDSLAQPLSWGVPVPLLGRQAHVAMVFTNNTVTAYVDGLSLGTKAHPSFGTSPGAAHWIGSAGLSAAGKFSGTIDEVAVYGSALSPNTIAIHNSKFLFGTNTASPTITGLPGTGTKTLLAGGSASFAVTASGTAPLSYQWTTNGTAIPGATASTITLSPSTVAESGTYGVTVSNPYGNTNSPTFVVNFVAPVDRYAQMVMADNPMAYWRLDETSGTTLFDSAGGHDGTYSGALTLGAAGALPGISDSGVHFTGGNAQVPFSAALNPATAFTVEFWCKPDDINIYVPMCSQFRSGNARDGWCFYMENDADSFETHMGNAGGVSHYAYGGAGPLVAGFWYHVVMTWDGTNILTLYSENQLVGRNTQVALGGTYVPNPSAPLMIGVRNGGAFPINGVLDEIAIYNYAFTTDQISNHWSIKFQPPGIVTQPVGVTNVEGSTISLTVTASGFPNTYQWVKDTVALGDVANFDTTPHYPNHVTNSTLTIAEAAPSDSGLYHVEVINSLGQTNSVDVSVLITPDTNAPALVSVVGLGVPNVNTVGGALPPPNMIKVTYNKRMDPTTTADVKNYSITPAVAWNAAGLMVEDYRSAALGGDWRIVYLTTTGLTPGQKYTVTVSGVKDQSQTPHTMATTTAYFRAPTFQPGAVLWDYYYIGSPPGATLANLMGNTYYQSSAPQTNHYCTVFDSDQITGGDLNNNAAFGALGDNYGCSLSGWLTPTVSGDYTFFLANDDGAELDLSPDANPQNAVMIASATGVAAFTEPTVPQTSAPQTLVAGHSYFIRALQVEGGGGDYVKVAWRIAGDTNAASTLTPISGALLSSYQPVPLPVFNAPIVSGGTLTLGWTGYQAVLQESTDLVHWTNVQNNPNPLVVSANLAQKFYRLAQ